MGARSVLAGLVGGLGVGVAVALHGIDGVYEAAQCADYCAGEVTDAPALPAAVLVTALLVTVALRRYGWLVAAAALTVAGAIFLYAVPDVFPSPDAVLVLGGLSGVALGGAMVAFGRSSPAGRAAIAVGLASGILAADLLVSYLDYDLNMSSDVPVVLLPLGLCVLAGLLALGGADRAGAAAGSDGADPVAESGGRGLAAAATVAVVAAVALGANYGLIAAETADGPRVDGVSDVYQGLRYSAAAVIAVALALVAVVRGEPRLARWIVAGAAVGVAAANVDGPFANVDGPFAIDEKILLLVTIIAGAVLGGVAAGLARRVPWEAVGLGMVGAGLLLLVDDLVAGIDQQLPALLIAFGMAMALGAGLATLAGETAKDLRPGPAAAAATAGFAAFLLVRSLLVTHQATAATDPGLLPAVWVLVAAVVAIPLFILGTGGRGQPPTAESEARSDSAEQTVG